MHAVLSTEYTEVLASCYRGTKTNQDARVFLLAVSGHVLVSYAARFYQASGMTASSVYA
jgi:hypothetical protein